MSPLRICLVTTLAMIAFASNSLLCRAALDHANIDVVNFTTIRLASGALTLWLLARNSHSASSASGNWLSALALFAYATGFAYAYVSLPAGTGALLLFGAVQATMIGYGLWRGEPFHKRQLFGLVLAFSGLIALLLPGLTAPPLNGSLLMLGAGVAWGAYSLRGQGGGNPIQVTAGNFLRALTFAACLSLFTLGTAHTDTLGLLYAIASGALASGIGYVIWYSVLPKIKATTAATVQLSVPVLAALAGILLLDEPVSLRLAIAAAAILGGIALVIVEKQRP